jgi:nitroreductase
MELIEAMKSVGTCRRFTSERVQDAVLWDAIDAARFGPQGGNRQPVRFVIVRDEQAKRRLGELYVERWAHYTGRPLTSIIAAASEGRAGRAQDLDAFALGFGEHPAIVIACAHLQSLYASDAKLGRLSIVGGASVYPIVQNFMLALRNEGVASALTTLLCAVEPEVKQLLRIPADYATACHIAIGYPARPFPRHLRRHPVEQLAFLERFDGSPLRRS